MQGVWEKNWMPFVHQNNLLVSYRLHPTHIVLTLSKPFQPVDIAYETNSSIAFEALPKESEIHGGPPPLYVPANITAAGVSYYLGVLHTRKQSIHQGIRMPHHFYIMEAQAPFAIKSVAPRRLPLMYSSDQKPFGFVSGLVLTMVDQTVHVFYGASDASAYMLSFTVKELELKYFGWL